MNLVVYIKPIGKRKNGKPNRRWLNEVQENLQIINVNKLKENTANRRE